MTEKSSKRNDEEWLQNHKKAIDDLKQREKDLLPDPETFFKDYFRWVGREHPRAKKGSK